MTNGGSQGLFILVAVVIFGIFVFMSYLLFRDTLKPNLSNVFEDGLVQSEDILGVEKPDKDVSGREDSLYVYAKIRSSYTDSDGINHSDIWAKFFKSGKGGLKLTGSSTSDGNYELGTSDMTGEIKIPNTVNGYAVTEVGY